jgi:hypothetical protein
LLSGTNSVLYKYVTFHKYMWKALHEKVPA